MKAGVAPIEEKANAINAVQGMEDLHNGSIMDLINADVNEYRYIYPNGHVIDDPLKAGIELRKLNNMKYNKVFYDPASPAEVNYIYHNR